MTVEDLMKPRYEVVADDVSEETFKKFKRAFDKMVGDTFEMMLYDLADEHGFEITSMHPIMEDSSYPLQDKDKA